MRRVAVMQNYLLRSTVLMMAALGFPLVALGTPMVEPARVEVRALYQLGDFIKVSCNLKENACRLSIKMSERKFEFGAKELKGLEPDPHGEVLYFGSADRFSFRTDVVCPEAAKGGEPLSRCIVAAVVEDGRIHELHLERREERIISTQAWPPSN